MPTGPGTDQSEQSGQNSGDRQHSAAATIQFPDPTTTSGSTAIPNSVLDDDQLEPETRLVYIMLRRLAATLLPRPLAQRELARRIGIPAHRVPRHLALLQRRGFILIDGQSSARTPLRYLLKEPMVHDDEFAYPRAPRSESQRARVDARHRRLSLVDRLIIMGVAPQIAGDLVAKYPEERVVGALRAAHRRRPRPRDPAAWVVAAIRQGWVARDAAVTARERQATQERMLAAYERRADAALAALPTETQESFRRQATEIVERRFDPRLAASSIGGMLITVEVRRIIAEQVGIPIPDVTTPAD